ncbi:MAG: glycosyltransferase [Candidatus Methanomethylophilaceae archaeon]|nr:glycosyltransferase [Candidatus Methanomethylophilaceae archaeon]
MRIAMVTDSYYPTRDGVVTSITITKEALEKQGHDVVVVAPDPGPKDRLPGVLYIKSIKFKSYQGYYIPIFPSRTARRLSEMGIDIIHIHGIAVMALRGWLFSKQIGVPVVLTFHTMVGDVLDYYSPLSIDRGLQEKVAWKYIAWMLKKMDAVIVPTPGIGRELCGRSHPKRVVTIPTGTDIRRFNPNVGENGLKERYGVKGRMVSQVGRLSFEKNIDVIIRAMHDVDATLFIAGSGPASDQLKQVAESEGLSDRVIFAGFIGDAELPSVYAASDVVVSASEFETQGLSILEAMASGVPVACRNARAFKDIIRDGENGCLFDAPEGCAEAINRCLNDDGTLARGALATAEEFSEENSVRKLLDLYSELVNGARNEHREPSL